MDRRRICEKKSWDALETIKTFDLDNIYDVNHDFASGKDIDLISHDVGTPNSLLVQSLVQQLCTLLERDPARAQQLYHTICKKLHDMKLIDESYVMGEFEVMRSQYQQALYHLVSVASDTEIPINLPATWPLVQGPTNLEWSRYHREFEELYYIAGGGFGNVFRARHRLDGVEYAVKKICIKCSTINSVMNHLAEVKTLASLNHPNIVSYKAAWLEPLIETNLKKKNESLEMETERDSYISNNQSIHPKGVHTFNTHNSDDLCHNSNESEFQISFHNSGSDNLDECNEQSETYSSSELSPTPEEDPKIICKLSKSRNYPRCSRINLKWATLYIQMSLCQTTLKEWLEERNKLHSVKMRAVSSEYSIRNVKTNATVNFKATNIDVTNEYVLERVHIDVIVDIFTQLVRGLRYIHSRGIVHHDIKPSNVFVGYEDNKIHVQLGDFGLACPLQQSHNGVALGTQLYAAPEQLAGECNPKSDMYSLGILLLEMVESFSTDMERVKTINSLRKGQIPTHLTANYPKIAHIIGKLVQKRPGKRLDSSQLLEELKLLKEDESDKVRALQEELAAKNDEILQLKKMLAQFNNNNIN